MKKTLINWLRLLGVVSLLSYTAAVIFASAAYPGYDSLAQAVSDLSANNALSKMLWEQLASSYGVCGILTPGGLTEDAGVCILEQDLQWMKRISFFIKTKHLVIPVIPHLYFKLYLNV